MFERLSSPRVPKPKASYKYVCPAWLCLACFPDIYLLKKHALSTYYVPGPTTLAGGKGEGCPQYNGNMKQVNYMSSSLEPQII